MKIKMRSIHANIINESKVDDTQNIRAHVEIGYSHDEYDHLQLNYHISVGEATVSHLYVIKCTFVIIDAPEHLDEKTILNQAVDSLQERIEIILALITEEMGFELLS